MLTACALVLGMATFVRAADEIAWHTDVAEAVAAAKEKDLPLLVYMTSSHCPYCVKMKNQTLSNGALAAEVNRAFVALTVSRGSAPDLERRMAVRAYPTTIILRADESEIGRVTGYVAAAQLTGSLQRFSALHLAAKTTPAAVK
ncbi:MAG: hypothetical protein C0483_24805 [Pirellula sp.]|nr:hypothetical protein [Pirellula sp.]